MQKIPCKCGNYIDVPAARLELINQLSVSMIVWAHGEPTQCVACGNVIVGIIPNIPVEHIKLTFQEIPKGMGGLPADAKLQQQKSRIIDPFGR